MLLSEIIEEVMLNTGQFIAGDISNLALTTNQFWSIVKKALGVYDKYKPVSKKFIITSTDERYVFPDVPGNPAPEFISSAYPTGYGYVNPFTITQFNDSVSELPQVVFRYVKPYLTTSMSGQFEVKANFKRKTDITYTDNTNTVIYDVEISDIDESDQYFFDLVEGLFLMTVGKFRSAFSLADTDIVMNAPQMIEDGKEKYEEALQNIQDTSKWWLAVGG